MGNIEIRCFGKLKKLLDEKKQPFPIIMNLEREIKACDLAARLDISLEDVEIVFVNGKAEALDHPVKPGDRVAFVPPGTPGPYRVILGFMNKDQEENN
ncbi:MAG: MoaD/ThiS family protein [Desulfotomaculaceae bacterium]|nr:MoaD/ThiS family protein [Desulfotomaculaceae bacterium]